MTKEGIPNNEKIISIDAKNFEEAEIKFVEILKKTRKKEWSSDQLIGIFMKEIKEGKYKALVIFGFCPRNSDDNDSKDDEYTKSQIYINGEKAKGMFF